MPKCEDYQINLSAMIDGELKGAELTETIRHLKQCETCMRVFEAFQALQQRLDHDGDLIPVPVRVWDKIVAETKTGKKAVSVHFKPVLWKAIGVAAVLVISFLLGYHSRHTILPVMESNDPIVLASNKGDMSEQEFLSLTRELLSANPVYHQKMYLILHTLQMEKWEGGLEPIEEADYQSNGNGDTFNF
jgi:hypothetical protein